MKASIAIEWIAFAREGYSSPTVVLVDTEVADATDQRICDVIFEQTNLYAGDLWRKIETMLPMDRTHTALSVGDRVRIQRGDVSKYYECANIGWNEIKEEVSSGN